LGIEPEGSGFKAFISGDFSKFRNSGEMNGLKSYNPTLSTTTQDRSANPAISPYLPTELLAAACGTQAIPPFLPAATAGFLGGLKAGAIPICPATTPRPGPVTNYVFGKNGNTNFYNNFGNVPNYGESDTHGFSGVVEYEFSDSAALKSTTAWRGVRLESLSELDGTPYGFAGGIGTGPANQIDQDQFSQEVQLTGNLGRFQYILGGFYFVENGTDRSDSSSLFPLSPSVATIDAIVRNKSIAGFGQIIFEVTDGVRLTGGLRYTEDTRDMVIRNRDTNVLTGAVTSSLGTFADGLLDRDSTDPFRATFQRKFDYISYLLSADWQANDNVFLYAKTGRSQRAGGLNTRAVAGGIPQVGFRPEIVTDYELGAKVDLLDRRVRVNLAAFSSDVSDVQRNVIGIGNGRLVSGVENAAKSTIRGIEAELTVAPTDGLTLGANAGYIDAEYKQFTNLDGSDWSNAEFPYTPKTTLAIFGDYSVDVGSGTLKLHADYAWRTKVYAVPSAAAAPQRVGKTAAEIDAISKALQDTALIPSYGLLNARIAYQFSDPNIEVSLFGRNLTSKEYISRLLPVEGTALGFTSYTPGDPRTYGASVTFRF
jgi:iron complex outermembrane receptor protein